jgi:hypothetical protein
VQNLRHSQVPQAQNLTLTVRRDTGPRRQDPIDTAMA